MTYPLPTKGFLQLRADATMLFGPFWVHPPTFPRPTLSTSTEPMSQGHCWKWHHKLKCYTMLISEYQYGTGLCMLRHV